MRKVSCKFLTSFLFIIVIANLSCNRNSELENKVKEFYSKTLVIPFDKMERRYCSFYSDTIGTNKKWHYYTFIDGADCQSCEIAKIAFNEQSHIGKIPQLEFSYIVRTPKEESNYVYRRFCNARIEGTLYLDTCDAFRSANPNFPKLKLFHAFVVDDTGRVVFVGNPFQNEEMQEVFMRVIDNEERK